MPEAAAADAKPAEAGPPHVYMHISQLRFSAARGDVAAREELLRLIKERGARPARAGLPGGGPYLARLASIARRQRRQRRVPRAALCVHVPAHHQAHDSHT